MSCERSFIVFTIYLFYCQNIEVINLIDKKIMHLNTLLDSISITVTSVNTTIDTVYNDTNPRGVEKTLLNYQKENFFLKWVIDLSVRLLKFLFELQVLELTHLLCTCDRVGQERRLYVQQHFV